MQRLVTAWCHLIGINNSFAIQTATGIVADASLVVAALVLLWLLRSVVLRFRR
jgi:hypothetical protein